MTARPPLLPELLAYMEAHHPRYLPGMREAEAIDPLRFETNAEMFLGWAKGTLGDDAIATVADGFARFTSDVNWAQARYEAAGHYENRSYQEVYDSHYSQSEEMTGYLWGVYLSNFLWPHHMDLGMLYEDRFVSRLAQDVDIVEIAPGPGGWGLWALKHLQQARLQGFDISETSIEIASAMARTAGVAGRAQYEVRDALALTSLDAESADAVICCFLIEHLEQPEKVFAVVRHLLRKGGRAWVTGALTAAQVDHIYEFHHESELTAMAEAHDLRVVETASLNPPRLLRKARFIPRSMSLILRRAGDP